jgi:hypothetical protein
LAPLLLQQIQVVKLYRRNKKQMAFHANEQVRQLQPIRIWQELRLDAIRIMK